MLVAVGLGLVIGAALGGLGGGGAIIAVPALVYVGGQSGQEATTSSLMIVGASAIVGTCTYASTRRVRWGVALVLSGAAIPSAWLGSYLNQRIDEDILLLGFSALMLIGAVAMVADKREDPSIRPSSSQIHPAVSANRRRPAPAALAVVAAALVVGFLTGFFGVGGGFVLVPVLVLVLRLPMDQVVGTSLMVVALNSGTSLLSRAHTPHFDWSVILPLMLSAAIATVLGKRFADRLPARRLKLMFAGLLTMIAVYTAWQSSTAIAADAGQTTATWTSRTGEKLTKHLEQA